MLLKDLQKSVHFSPWIRWTKHPSIGLQRHVFSPFLILWWYLKQIITWNIKGHRFQLISSNILSPKSTEGCKCTMYSVHSTTISCVIIPTSADRYGISSQWCSIDNYCDFYCIFTILNGLEVSWICYTIYSSLIILKNTLLILTAITESLKMWNTKPSKLEDKLKKRQLFATNPPNFCASE